MRLVITFYENNQLNYQQNKLTGLIYSLIRETSFNYLHDLPKTVPRFYNFSQLFLSKKKLRLLISSAYPNLIKELLGVIKSKSKLFLGETELNIQSSKIIENKINKNNIIKIKTETPLIVRIPKEKYHQYKINNIKEVKKYPYFYWRPKTGIPFKPFIQQLESSIYKKYRLCFWQSLEEKPIFHSFEYIKTVDLPYFKDGKKISRPGTIWVFQLNPLLEKKLVEFILDVGIGELNSQGYGFVNLIN